MNDSQDLKLSVFCLCCARLYMRTFKGFQGAIDTRDEREACPMCSKAISDLLLMSDRGSRSTG